MKLKKNEKNILFLYKSYKRRVCIYKRYSGLREALVALKSKFRQEFICALIENRVCPIYPTSMEEIKLWARIYNYTK